jgi:hypothetical protein
MLPEALAGLLDSGAGLSGQELYNWLRTAGQQVFTEFDTGAAGLDFLRSNDFQIRTQTFYDIRRQVLDINKYQEALVPYEGDNLIPVAWHDTSHGLGLTEKLLYRIEVTGVDPNTGEDITKTFAIGSNQRLSKNEVTDILGSMIEGEAQFYSIVPEEYNVVAALARPGAFKD